MLTVRHGNIFCQPGSRMIAHGCNAKGVMGSGIAVEIKKRFPVAHMNYLDVWKKRKLKLGEVIYAQHASIYIANCITQLDFGRDSSVIYVSYGAVKGCMDQVALDVGTIFPDMPIHIPFIGGGLANGDRGKLLDIFAESFKETNATLWLN